MSTLVTINRTFDSLLEAEEFVRSYKLSWHPQGYGTQLDIRVNSQGAFVVSGYRYSSCD